MSTPAGALHGQALSAEGRRILRLLDRDYPLAYEAGGRPFFADHHADFNISHSRNMAALAWRANAETADRPRRVGCDIQYADPRKRHAAVSRHFFLPPEQDYIAAASGEGEALRRFYRVWVLKEAWLKMRGLSAAEMAKAPAFSIGGEVSGKAGAALPPDCFLYEIDAPAGERYMLALVCGQGYSGEAPVFRWFSALPAAVTRIADIYAAHSPANTVTPNM